MRHLPNFQNSRHVLNHLDVCAMWAISSLLRTWEQKLEPVHNMSAHSLMFSNDLMKKSFYHTRI